MLLGYVIIYSKFVLKTLDLALYFLHGCLPDKVLENMVKECVEFVDL
jgi:hypothetical protein